MITELIFDFLAGYGLLSIIGDIRTIIRMYSKKQYKEPTQMQKLEEINKMQKLEYITDKMSLQLNNNLHSFYEKC